MYRHASAACKIACLLCHLILGGCTGFSRENGPRDGGSSAFSVIREIPDGSDLNAIWGANENSIHVVGDDGTILDWDGSSWTEVEGVTGALMSGVFGFAPDDVYAVGALAADLRGLVEHYDGRGWTQQITVPDGLMSIWGHQGTLWAGGIEGKIYKKTPTRDWYLLLTVEKNPYVTDEQYSPLLYGLWGNHANMIVVAADVDMFVNFVGNSMWVPLYDPVDRTRAYRSVWGPPATTPYLFLGANYFGVWHFVGKDEATLELHEERARPEDKNKFVWGIYGWAPDRVVFVGDEGRIMTWDGGPDGLKIVASPTTRTLTGVWGASPDDVWIVGTGGLILRGKLTF